MAAHPVLIDRGLAWAVPALLCLLYACGGDADPGADGRPGDSVTGGAAIVGRVEPPQSDIGVIAVRNGFETATTLTQPDGTYRLPDLRSGEYSLIVSGLGFFTDTSVRTVVVQEGSEVEAPVVRLRPLGAGVTFVGQVVDKNGFAPLAGVQIAIRCRSGICSSLSVVTDALGVYSVGVWPELAADVVFTKGGYRTDRVGVDGQPPRSTVTLPRVELERVDP